MTDEPQVLDRIAFERYLDMVNRAILDSRALYPYNAVLHTLNERLALRPCVVTVVGTEPGDETTHGCVLDQLLFSWVPTTPDPPAARWFLRREHLDDVLDAPWRYRAAIRELEFPPFSLVRPLNVPFTESDSPDTPVVAHVGVGRTTSPPRPRRASF
jgi:hypothetical protein